jgi:regulatory protein YycI of two-component signal transduction system YycFG
MAQGLDKDTRLVIIVVILIVQIVLIGALVFYFRKKENDTLYTLFQLQDRLNKLEFTIQKKRPASLSQEPIKTEQP